MANKLYKHTFINNEVQERMMNELMTEHGFKLQEIWRFALNEMYRKKKPAYMKEKPEDDPFKNLSNERYCTDVLGGTVDGDICRIVKPSGLELEVPLAEVKSAQV